MTANDPLYRVGETVWYWPVGWGVSTPPWCAIITAQEGSSPDHPDQWGLHVIAPPGVYLTASQSDVWAVDVTDNPDGLIADARFARRERHFD